MIANTVRATLIFGWFITGFVWPDMYGIWWMLIEDYPLITWEFIVIYSFIVGILTWCFAYLITRPRHWWWG